MARGWEGLPSISQIMYEDTYFLPGEDYEGWVFRVTNSYANDSAHQQRLARYFKNYWLHSSTPPSSNAGTDRGMPISCFVKQTPDTKEGIFNSWIEDCWLGAYGGGVGDSKDEIREINHPVGPYGGKSSGLIPFEKVEGTLTNAISQGGIRRFSKANYLLDSHPEIQDHLDIRKPTGDQSRRAMELHHAISITDDFMKVAISNSSWDLISPKSKTTISTVAARSIWSQTMENRGTTGEPYILFKDNANNQAPIEYKILGLPINTSNLCTEIMLHTATNYTNVCCLSSINLEYWDEFQPELDQFIADCTDYLDNILQDFIDRTLDKPGFENARAAAINERALGLGVMGFHSLLQSKHIPFESAIAQGLNKRIFSAIRTAVDLHQTNLGIRCPMNAEANAIQPIPTRRNIVALAIAPTMSISNLCNLASSGIEPWISNAFTKKLKQGSFAVKNKHLAKLLTKHAADNSLPSHWIESQWDSIKKHEGSVQHLDFLDQYSKDVFKTAFEIDQRWVIEHAADRQPFIDQGQSLNLFIPGNSHVQFISDLHVLAWRKGLKSLYYLRSTNPNRASTASTERKTISTETPDLFSDTCLGCT